MEFKHFFVMLFLCITLSLFSQETSSTFLHFDTNEYTLDAANKAVLQGLASTCKTYSDVELEIVGHTDQDGSNEYNLKLAKQRADAVFDYLSNEGLSSEVMNRDWKGELQLLINENSSQAKESNRRVEVRSIAWNINDVDQLEALLSSDNTNQKLTYTNQKLSYDLAQGTRLDVPSDAFEHADGSPVISPVKIEVLEAFAMTDFIANDLFTECGGRLLETGGMMHVSATVNGQEVKLRDGKKILLTYPEQKVEEGMELFYGSNQDGAVAWEETGVAIETQKEKSKPVMMDLTPLLEYDITELEKPTVKFDFLPTKPKRLEKPYPPSQAIYSNEKYERFYANYEEKLKLYNDQGPEYKEAMNNWNGEIARRMLIIGDLKQELIDYEYDLKIASKIKQLQENGRKEAPVSYVEQLFKSARVPSEVVVDMSELYRSAFGKYRSEVSKRSNYDLSSMIVVPYYERYDKVLISIIERAKKAAIAKRFKETGKISREGFSRYLVGISRLGWINCDRFWNEDRLTELTIHNGEKDTKYYMVFKERKSIIRPNARTKQVKFKGIPQDKSVKLIALKVVNEKPYLAVKDHKLGKDDLVSLDFKPATLREIRTELNSVHSIF